MGSSFTFVRASVLIVLLVPFLGGRAAAQEHAVSGRVLRGAGAAEPAPLAGVAVSVKGTSVSTITNSAGVFTLTAPSPADTLVFSLLGFSTVETPIDGRSTIDVVLQEQAIALEELVVVGYGVQERQSLTGAVSAIDGADVARSSATTTAEALVGKVQGITTRITNSYLGDARPGSNTIVQIRNLGEPLFVIDGVPHSTGQFNNLNIADIESISILKDASASVYGFRASDGVVLVTTKKGAANQAPQININGYYGIQNLTRYPFDPPANAYQFQRAWIESQQNLGQPRTISPEELEKWRLGTEPGYESYNQYDYVINNPNAAQYNLNASVSGGGANASYYFSVGRVSQDYVMEGHNFNRTNIRANIRAELSQGLAIGTQLSARQENRTNVAIPGRDDVIWNGLLGINSSWPMDNPYANDNPKYVNGDVRYLTRLASTYTKEVAGWQEDIWRNMSGNFFAEYRFPFGLLARATYAHTYKLNTFDRQRYSYDAYCYDAEGDSYEVCGGFDSPLRNSNQTTIQERFAQIQLSHDHEFGPHSVSAVAAFELSDSEIDSTGVQSVPPSNYNRLIDFVEQNDLINAWATTARASYIGRLNYDYAGRYLLEALGRYDGSYLYAPGKRWGFFPGISVGWRITEEPFLRDKLGFLDELKIRASWGQAGREQGIQPWGFIGGATYGIGNGYLFDGEVIPGTRPRGLPVTNLTWVTSTSRNIGFDFAAFGSRLTGEFDVFERKLSGLPAERYDALLPSEVGYELPNENLESEANRGVEGMLSYTDRFGPVSYTLAGNFTLARRKVLDRYRPRYGNSWDQYRTATEDRWWGVDWGYQVIGRFQSMQEIESHPVNIDGQGNRTLLPGDFIFEDLNGDGIINEMDERPIGFAIEENPILGYGLHAGLRYGSIDLSIDFAGGSMYSYNQNLEMRYPFQADHNSQAWMLEDRWHRADPYDDDSEWVPGRYPAIRRGQTSHSNFRHSDFWQTNVRYLRLKRVEVGYELPAELLSRVGISGARVYASGANLMSFDNLKHLQLDPEIAQDSGLRYPTQRVFSIGFSTSLGSSPGGTL